MTRPLQPSLFLLTCLVLSGCGASGLPEPERFPVSGKVTLDGEPLIEGVVYFKTIASGAIDSVEIKDGQFQGAAQSGDRRVEISAYETIPSQDDTGMGTPTQKNRIPPCYNLESTLTAKVAPEGPNQFTFELSSQ